MMDGWMNESTRKKSFLAAREICQAFPFWNLIMRVRACKKRLLTTRVGTSVASIVIKLANGDTSQLSREEDQRTPWRWFSFSWNSYWKIRAFPAPQIVIAKKGGQYALSAEWVGKIDRRCLLSTTDGQPNNHFWGDLWIDRRPDNDGGIQQERSNPNLSHIQSNTYGNGSSEKSKRKCKCHGTIVVTDNGRNQA